MNDPQEKTETATQTQQVFEQSDLYRNCVREAKWILAIWLIAFAWVITYCTLFGYQVSADHLPLVFGMPSWVFWGVFLPWGISVVVSIWFALTMIQNDRLDE
ncbi:DUF997 family protein [Rhodopirellula sp. MGV]|uniref:DUF997 family protein n=1 Tax=Rhodopirellula sp. MGV TaxID=2023130 RepID=UPI000B96511A|nr:DUF997 family protein [Rhodopirellula sp. MGV]OYP36387.1 hypothetical protein CGZ80_08750 [Rhodopirellula sp. MGV]PNY38379.1 DUF997 domain-containing protein [Rhodopirellula baltica]